MLRTFVDYIILPRMWSNITIIWILEIEEVTSSAYKLLFIKNNFIKLQTIKTLANSLSLQTRLPILRNFIKISFFQFISLQHRMVHYNIDWHSHLSKNNRLNLVHPFILKVNCLADDELWYDIWTFFEILTLKQQLIDFRQFICCTWMIHTLVIYSSYPPPPTCF